MSQACGGIFIGTKGTKATLGCARCRIYSKITVWIRLTSNYHLSMSMVNGGTTMRFAIALIAIGLASAPANAAKLFCSAWDGEFAIASCPLPKASLPFKEVHISEPGTYTATVNFSAPLSEVLHIFGYRDFHFDIYNPAGKLIDGNNGFDSFFTDLEIPAGLTGFSLQYSVPRISSTKTDWFDNGEIDRAFYGTSNYFLLEGGTRPPSFTFNISRISPRAVPEPASWAMMLAGFGLAGAAMRKRKESKIAA